MKTRKRKNPKTKTQAPAEVKPLKPGIKRRGLTPREQRFVSIYLKDLNASEAARATGYKGDRADQAGHRIKSRPVVKAEIDRQLSIAMGADLSTVKHRILAELQKEAFESDTIVSMQVGEDSQIDRYNPAKMKALELLAKYAGLLIEKHEHTGKDGGPIITLNFKSRPRSRDAGTNSN